MIHPQPAGPLASTSLASNSRASDLPSPGALTPDPAHGPAPEQVRHGTEAEQAGRFGKARAARSTVQAEDYVELIADLLESEGRARAVDVARRQGVSHVTVVKTLGRLRREGLVGGRPYHGLFLTDAGQALAERVRMRHRVVVEVLLAVGVPPADAAADAEGIEHHVSEATLAAFSRFLAAGGPDGS